MHHRYVELHKAIKCKKSCLNQVKAHRSKTEAKDQGFLRSVERAEYSNKIQS